MIFSKRSKNRYSLTRRSSKKGYDWWWHSFIGKHAGTGALKPFFIEYYVINPESLFPEDDPFGVESDPYGLKQAVALA